MSIVKNNKELPSNVREELLNTLKTRFKKNKNFHNDIDWEAVAAKLESNPAKLWSLNEMEKTGGEPDVVAYDKTTAEYIFYDCSTETPKGRRSLCYDREALDARKEHKPENSAIDMATEMGVTLLSEEEYRYLHQLGKFDTKTSSWLQTPTNIRKLGGAIFADFRYNTIFIYHNGAQSYYGVRGFRGSLRV